jgi:hypothetical protein
MRIMVQINILISTQNNMVLLSQLRIQMYWFLNEKFKVGSEETLLNFKTNLK